MSRHWLLSAPIQTVVDVVKQYGPIAFFAESKETDEEVTAMNVASVAAKTISYLDKQNHDLTFFLSKSTDDSVASVVYSFESRDEWNFGQLIKTTTYMFGDRQDIVRGPIVNKEGVSQLVDMFNSTFGKNDNKNYRFIVFSNTSHQPLQHAVTIEKTVEIVKGMIGVIFAITVIDCGQGGRQIWDTQTALSRAQWNWGTIFSGKPTDFVEEYEGYFTKV